MAASKKDESTKETPGADCGFAAVVEDAADGSKRIIVDPSIEREVYVEQALADPSVMQALVDGLCGEMRRARQFCATIVAQIAREKPEVLVDSVDHLVDALHRPEAQTRWEALDALYSMVPVAGDKCLGALEGAEASLWDEESGPARLAAFKFMCAAGATGPAVSDKVWGNIDEAIQCYHGDLEFPDMLGELISFARGNVSDDVKKALSSRMKFDAENGKGVFKNKAAAIVEACAG